MSIRQALVDTIGLQAIYFDLRDRMAFLYRKPAGGIPASDLAEGVIPDISGKADKTDTVLLTSLTRGRIPGTTIGDGSIAFGDGVIASGLQSQAFGYSTSASGNQAVVFGMGSQASGDQAFAVGAGSIASGNQAFASGGGSRAVGPYSHAEGSGGVANGNATHVEGISNIGNGKASHVGGMFNVADSYLAWEEWTADTLYEVGRKVKIGVSENNEIVYYGYICKTQNQDHEFDSSKWDLDYKMNFARIVGNGTDNNHRSNALALGWDGTLYLNGKLYILCNGDSTGGQEVATKSDILSKQDAPASGAAAGKLLGLAMAGNELVPVWSSLPVASTEQNGYGVIRVNSSAGIGIYDGYLYMLSPNDDTIKAGTNGGTSIKPSIQHKSVFFGLAKAAGYDLKDVQNLTFGIYPDEAKIAIQKMLGFDNLLGPYEMDSAADQAYALNELFIFNGKLYKATAAIAVNDVIVPGTNCDPVTAKDVFVKKTDIATTSKHGLVKINPGYGVSINSSGALTIYKAVDQALKEGSNNYLPVVPKNQHTSVYYALSKLAGVDLASTSGETVGVYPQPSKTAIQSMLGIEANIPLVETITGATVSIIGMPNVRYICETAISELTITPPASGSIVVRFTAGSGCIVVLPQTVKLPEWFDISSLEAGTTYEIIITDGVYGGVMSWAA